MTKKKAIARKARAKKLKLKKETLKDLDAKKAERVRGGMLNLSGGCPKNSAACESETSTCPKLCG